MTSEGDIALYRIDPAISRFTVQAFASGLLSFLGHSPTFAVSDFSGGLGISPGTMTGSWCRVTVKADSLNLLDRVKPQDAIEIEHRVHSEVLLTQQYPEIGFESDDIFAAGQPVGDTRPMLIRGKLSLRGVARPVELKTELIVFIDGVRLAGEFELQPSVHGIRPVTALAGSIRSEDRVAVVFDLGAWKESATRTQ